MAEKIISCGISPSSEENPFDIDEKATALDEKEDGQKDGDEEGEGAEEMEEDQTDQPGEENGQEPKTEAEEEEGGGEKADGEEESTEKDEVEEEKEERGQEAGRDEDLTIPNDKGHEPKVCMSKKYCTCALYTHSSVLCVTVATCNSYRRRRKEQVMTRSSRSRLRGRSTTQTVRPESRAFRATQLWSWQERHRRGTRLKRYTVTQHVKYITPQTDGMR